MTAAPISTSSFARRVSLAQARLALSLLLAGVAAMHVGAWLGAFDKDGLWTWTVFSVIGFSIPTLLIKAGKTQHLADPSLTLPQMLLASTCAAWAYTLAGSAHAVVTLMQALALSFGIFGIDARSAICCAGYAIGIFAVAMARQCLVDPRRFHPVDDLLLFAFLVLIVVGIVINTMRVNGLRARIRSQKRELQDAVAQIRQLATRDELTGLVNRRFMQEALAGAASKSSRTGAPWCVALIDLDHFKHINDTHGHAAGDDVLRWFAAHARSAVRATDVVARWGGEEFLVLMSDTDTDAARAALERLRTTLATTAPAPPQGLAVTFSAGLARHGTGESVMQVLERADQRCYAAKRAGRDRIEV